MSRHWHRIRDANLGPRGFSLCFQSHCPQVFSLEGLRGLWGCRSFKLLDACSWRRNARRRDPGELAGFSKPLNPATDRQEFAKPHSNNVRSNGQPRLRDQLCVLIRQYDLDPTLVKAYAADFCGTQTLRGASRDLVESFICNLSASAKENRDALICKLNSYSQPQEAQS